MSSSNTNNQNIKPKSCVYGCGIQIYWNSSVNEYWEVFTKKKHICPNRGNKSSGTTTTITITKDGGITPPSTAQKPRYFNPSARKRTPYASTCANQQQPKPKMSNSFEYIQGSIAEIQKKYEILSDIVTEYGGKVHGSQRDRDKTGLIDLMVYYEVPLGQREEVKQKFNQLVRNTMALQQRN